LVLTYLGFFAKPLHGLPGNFIATMGMPVTAEGRQEDGDLTLAARNAVPTCCAAWRSTCE
jgi:hypothetical protein